MPLVTSIWTMTYDAAGINVVICNATGDQLADELELGRTDDVAAGQYAGAANARPINRGKSQRDLTITVIRTHADLVTAWAFTFEADIAIPSSKVAPLKFAIAGGNTYQIADATFKNIRTKPYRPGPFKTQTVYTITGGALTKL